MEDDGYSRPEFWLSDGWAVVMTQGWQAPLYWFRDADARTVAAVHPVGHPAGRSRRAGVPCQLLRGGRLRPLDGEAPAHRGGVGDRGQHVGRRAATSSARESPHPRPAVSTNALHGRCLGVDIERVHALPGIPGRARGRRRVQRKVHGQPVRAAGWLLRHSAGPYPRHLPQLLPTRGPLGLQRRPAGPGSLTGHDLHHRRPPLARRSPPAHAGRRHRRPPVQPEVDPSGLVLRRARQPALRGDHRTARVLPHPGRAAPCWRHTHRPSPSCPRRTPWSSSGRARARRPGCSSARCEQLGTLARYVPFDVSDEFLRDAASTLSDEYDGLAVHLVIGDFSEHLAAIPTEGRRMVAFLGGTIGNLDPAQRARFLFDLNCTMSSDDSLLLGTDLVKDRRRLVAAYDDAAGVTAQFNKNVLHVLNEQLGGDFDPDLFTHVALWNEDEQWIEMRLRAQRGHRCDAARGRHLGALRPGRGPPDRDQRQVHSGADRGGAAAPRDSWSTTCGAPTRASSSSPWPTPSADHVGIPGRRLRRHRRGAGERHRRSSREGPAVRPRGGGADAGDEARSPQRGPRGARGAGMLLR